MKEQDYLTISAKYLEELTEKLELADQDTLLEIEFHDGIIEIIDEAEKTFIINQHSATQKIWFSSPFSGADYFSLSKDSWVNKEGVTILEKLSNELQENYGLSIQ